MYLKFTKVQPLLYPSHIVREFYWLKQGVSRSHHSGQVFISKQTIVQAHYVICLLVVQHVIVSSAACSYSPFTNLQLFTETMFLCLLPEETSLLCSIVFSKQPWPSPRHTESLIKHFFFSLSHLSSRISVKPF